MTAEPPAAGIQIEWLAGRAPEDERGFSMTSRQLIPQTDETGTPRDQMTDNPESRIEN